MSAGNAGRFRPGPDPRRHEFTRAERRRGYKAARKAVAALDVVDGPAWLLQCRVRAWYQARTKKGG